MKKKIPKRDLFKYILISALFFALVWSDILLWNQRMRTPKRRRHTGAAAAQLLHLAIWLFGHAVLMQNPIRLLHFYRAGGAVFNLYCGPLLCGKTKHTSDSVLAFLCWPQHCLTPLLRPL